ncbi:two-component system, OmpR family, sensor histidine kinase MtrB [Amycolatopsis arida]|uniref:histidine kinase n=1 Tax=Amycolatopsis arida TaxID=587909 RepID=A0A1I6AR70_9PSEU|nr:HAMP domain-containing sensor histidine kinase [Amycolatopsis arida]TDX97593.1 two-component system sensor histidine kinase MtrB [Amycolatopsis arida]SFQ71203.1 two-component system, OmpR family, sensor histidine kinase MtrB [Amycolatopsis arida]
MTAWGRARSLLGGLRARLVVAFVAVAVLGAATAAWASAASASNSLVAEAQRRISDEVERRVTATAPTMPYPPDQAALDRLRTAVGGPALVTYGALRSAHGAGLDLVPPELRSATAAAHRLLVQRVESGGGPKLLVGTPVMITDLNGRRRPSGVEVYAVRDLGDVQRQVDALTANASRTSALALPVAVLLALLAARGVLRPVRDLRTAARRLAGGDLGARLRPRGSDELAELAETFNETAASLQRSVGKLARMEADARRFVADVSHELRTPLTTLTAVTEVLEAEAERMPGDARESAMLAVSETRKLAGLVEDLIEVSRFDAGTATLRRADVELRAVVRDGLRARGWLDEVELDAPDPLPAALDRRRLDVIAANLVGNALRHGAPTVVVRLRGDEEWVYLEVVDHGPGLSDEVARHVFDRFYKADAARARSEGSGLGMAITAENVALHGGAIEAGNAEGAGARFVVRLPRWAGERT